MQIQRRTEAFYGRSGSGIKHPHQHQLSCAALNLRANRGGITFAFDEVAFPVARRQAVFGFRLANM